MDLSGKVALVTGGSRGIGRAVAEKLARHGAKVALSYASNDEAAKATVAAIEAAGGQALAIKFDVADAARVKEAITQIVSDLGSLDILIANAGVSIDGLLMRFSEDDLEKIFRTNVFGAFYCAKAASRTMMKARWGRIVFMGSVVGEAGNGGQSAYAGTKAALEGISKSLAKELASRGITSNVVAPGYIQTDMTDALTEKQREQIIAAIPAGEIGKADDVAEAVLFLASDRARYVTGQVLSVNGGMYM